MRRVVLVAFASLTFLAGLERDSGAARRGREPRRHDPREARPAGEAAFEGVDGSFTFAAHCASCHGSDGRGEGPLTEKLRYQPPDLTRLARRNGGAFPAERVHRIVDGRRPLPGHGGPEMPAWGDVFKNADTAFDDGVVKEKIRSLVEHLRSIQER